MAPPLVRLRAVEAIVPVRRSYSRTATPMPTVSVSATIAAGWEEDPEDMGRFLDNFAIGTTLRGELCGYLLGFRIGVIRTVGVQVFGQ